MFSLDCETLLIRPGCLAPALVVVAIGDGARADLFHATDAGPVLASILDEHIVGHNIAYDLAVLGAAWPDLLPTIFDAYESDRITDTAVRQKLIDIGLGCYRGVRYVDGKAVKLGYSLADLVKRHLGAELPKADTYRLRYGELLDTPLEAWPAEAVRYAQDDAHATHAVWAAQEKETHLLADQYRQTRAAFWLHLMSCWGLRTDPEAVRAFADQARAKYERLKLDVIAAGLKRPDRVLKSGARKGLVIEGARDTKAAGERLVAAYARVGKACPVTDAGAPALDAASCRASGDAALIAYADLSAASKVLGTDVPLLESGSRTPIQARFEVLLETGRTSSSPNVQNRPTGRKEGSLSDRDCFVPRPGFVYAAADYSSMELRTLAQVCITLLGRSTIGDAFKAGRDPHDEMAARIMGVPYDVFMAKRNAEDPEADNARGTAKVANFGFPGGLGAATLVHYAALTYGVTLTEDQARALKGQWLRQWPEMTDYFAYINRLTEADFPQIAQLKSGRYRGGVTYCAACNSLFQGLAADAAKEAGWLIARACYVDTDSPLFGSRIVNFIHDEFVAEVPEELGHEAAQELARLMQAGAERWLPDVPVKVGKPLLMRRWLKNAKPVWENGRQVPCM